MKKKGRVGRIWERNGGERGERFVCFEWDWKLVEVNGRSRERECRHSRRKDCGAGRRGFGKEEDGGGWAGRRDKEGEGMMSRGV